MKTYQPIKKEVKRDTRTIDAGGRVLGRVATEIATGLMGKDKVTYSRHMDSGDKVIVTNADKVVITGRKAQQKVYQSHSGYPGGFKEVKYERMMEVHPERVLEHAVEGMLPDNKLKAQRMKRLTVVTGDKK
ncbi:MAG: 50S ribosomal protein L13 [Candidatus Woesebacteria bacterium]|nr:MAG: 50S ribosomal protein L13 [Candidatus Woesebacteria bacterium]